MAFKHLLPTSMAELLDGAGITTTKEIITLSVWDIKKCTNLSIDEILLVKDIISEHKCPSILSCNKLKSKIERIPRDVATGCADLDKLLRGGLRRGTITEVFGESGCGKTQLALQIAITNWAHGSAYICTEDLFPAKRFEEMKRALPAVDSTVDYGKNIFIEHVTEGSDLLFSINVRLPKLLEQNKLSLVIIDSIAAPFRCESTNYVKRAEELREIAISLLTVAQKHNLAVLCINQVTSAFDTSTNLLPALGLAWSNMVAARLMIEKNKSNTLDSKYQIRELSITFAPDLPNSRIKFIINSSGIETLQF